jgi:hypothetical protein
VAVKSRSKKQPVAKRAAKSAPAPRLQPVPATAPPPTPEACAFDDTAPLPEYWRWCPRCGHELHNEKCKLRCEKCHYFMSCSDFD